MIHKNCRHALVLIGTLLFATMLWAQETQDAKKKEDESWKKIYRATATKYDDLIHTKLDVRFDYEKCYMYGKEWVTLQPHFYPADSLSLDAKGMDIHEIAMVEGGRNVPLKYMYDGETLRIRLGRTYRRTEKYTLYIDYVSKPNELKVHKGSAAITDAKGLYFINPHGDEKDKPTEIWTQGETESNSVWFPTIDKPDQKCTEEISMTVPAKYVTLSNGLLVSQKNNGDGTRTDHWKEDLPNAPYLFFMGVGDYTIVKDSYKGKEVAYYVEKQYAPVARRIFGHTPEMIAFYSRVTGVDFPWQKYDQIVGRDYVSGAMENTTCTLHGEQAQQDARELTDGNEWEDVIAHELFHHWFGDLVTCESWSNITLNESFADFSETLWNEYKYGKDAGDAVNYAGIQSYLANPDNADKDLVRFYYADKEDVFDQVSYPKGGRILNMLRNYVGDSAFWKSLNLYLNTYKFQSAEAQELRLAFEQVTGQDLNWYWNQWYYGSGHPKLTIDYAYDDAAGKATLIISQTQETGKIFKLPMAIDVYQGNEKIRHKVMVQDKVDTFVFDYKHRPELINVDGDKILLCEKTDNKTLDNFIVQFRSAGLYLDRREAIEYCAKHQDDPKAIALMKAGLKDRFYKIRNFTLSQLKLDDAAVKTAFEPIIAQLAESDPSRVVKATAIDLLGGFKDPQYEALFTKATADSSYTVSGNALESLLAIDSAAALKIAQELRKAPSKGELAAAIAIVLIKNGDESDFDQITTTFDNMPVTQAKFEFLRPYISMLVKVRDLNHLKRGVDAVLKFKVQIPAAYRGQTDPYFDAALNSLITRKLADGLQDQADYIKSAMSAEKKD